LGRDEAGAALIEVSPPDAAKRVLIPVPSPQTKRPPGRPAAGLLRECAEVGGVTFCDK